MEGYATAKRDSGLYEAFKWVCDTKLEKFHGDSISEADKFDEIFIHGNALMIGGASAMWERLVNGSTTVSVFSATNARIGVGDSTTAVTNTQIDLQAATNKFRKLCSSVTHSDTTGTAGSATTDFVATFATGEANFAWNEWGVFNGTATDGSAAGGRMLNRKVESLGTKTSAATWQLTVTLGLTV